MPAERVPMRQSHAGGDKLFVDYAGDGVPVVNRLTGEVRQAQIFVAVMGASNFTYAEATWTQRLADWIDAHARALEAIGGIPNLIVPDNTKVAVIKACLFDPQINRTYADMASHYATAILPARPTPASRRTRSTGCSISVSQGCSPISRWRAAMDATHESSARLAVSNCSSLTILVCHPSTPMLVTICWRYLNNDTLDDQRLSPVSSPWTNGTASLEIPPTRTPSSTASFITPIASFSPARACARSANR